jgi:hypothetical protein
MPKTQSEAVFRHYPPLRDIHPCEWDDMFCRQGERWTEDEDAYVQDWYGRIDTMEIAYALSRLPYSVQERARKLSVPGTHGMRRKE